MSAGNPGQHESGSARLGTIAEEVRAASGRLEKAVELMTSSPELVAKYPVLARSLEYERDFVTSLWGEFAGRCGTTYQSWVKLGAPRTPAVVLSEVSAAVMRLTQEEWARLAGDERFVYRDFAKLCSLMRARMEERGFPRERLDELQRPAGKNEGSGEGGREG